jgi:hypothetical protein
VNTYRRVPVTLVLVDSGQLITFAACGRLDLLDVFERPIRIVDVVRAECLRYPGRLGHAAISAERPRSLLSATVLSPRPTSTKFTPPALS